MSGRYAGYVERLVRLVTTSPGRTAPALRAAVQARGRRLAVGAAAEAAADDAVPAALVAYVESVLRNAYRITDHDVETLKRTHSEDEVFETTVNAAVAAGIARLERSLALLKGGDA